MNKLSYALGMNIGRQFSEMGVENFSATDFAQAVADVLEGKTPALTPAEAQQQLELFIKEQEAREAKKGEAARKVGEDFLAENAKREGVKVTESGLQYMVLEAGLGKHPSATDNVKCHYEGRLIDGTVFDSSYRRGEPATFPLNGVISGWTEGLQLMGEGAKFRFFIPYNLAYGSRGAGASIPPYAALIFDVELIQVL
ncbi:MAG: FKBP-type peptidyl-prolyl cis-trans isomerase [Bacteroidaceae bacterium]|uniref:Peptidyl-prolyl cis-trans isomerase n=1 Tax=Pseudoprevotella muciniphila TaxID=2133944 RepID=A0A5P8E6S4_9BACT|nr:FKBP-type peptidyl-prolyl cis-trans isomerase [Pseudoprevotella muciniphila]MBQ7057244.1 FKBP-type peptidyl-prolyl cis-trans isomerase [Bacteroidaceae bacterium]MBQ7664459.1 FKBP-type peptidyl-prolyl cis-trans isomerase [Bacteroidaceae bacterium]QFQ12681.1 FKBP-type peptidyl-prolyl cis-trans isomerase [Pseudoprevotella muciniphila]